MFAASCCSETNSSVSKPRQGRHYGNSTKTSFAVILWIACTWSSRAPDGRIVKSAEFALTSSNLSRWLLLLSCAASLRSLVSSFEIQVLGGFHRRCFHGSPAAPLTPLLTHSHPTPILHCMPSSLALKMGTDLINQSLLCLIVTPFWKYIFYWGMSGRQNFTQGLIYGWNFRRVLELRKDCYQFPPMVLTIAF